VANAAAPVDTVAPVITISSVGNVYSVSPGTWTVDGLTYSYQWQVAGSDGIGTDGNHVAGSTSSTYIPDATEHGQLWVIITVTRVGYTTPAPVIVPWGIVL
jgi:hypothetical protein